MATTIIKGYDNDNQAKVDSTGHLFVTTAGGGAATDVNITEVGGQPLTLGQHPMATSIPVVIASDQSPVEVTIEGVNPNQNSVLIYGEQTSVPVGSETVIATYTAPVGKTSCLLLAYVGGENVAEWIVYNNAAIYDKKYTSAAALNENFDFKTGSSIVPGQIIGVGNTITVTVNQIGTSSADFNARIQVLEIG